MYAGVPKHFARARGKRGRPADDLRNAEIRDFEGALAREHEVLGLDVAVQHAVLVRVMQTRADREQDRARDVGREAAGVEPAPHRPAGEPFHHQQAETFVVDEVVDRHDVRVVQRREHSRFGDEPRPQGWIGAERDNCLIATSRPS